MNTEMKLKGIGVTVLTVGLGAVLACTATAQVDTATGLSVNMRLADQKVVGTVGARAMFDAAFYQNSGTTKLKPGFRLTDARIRASLKVAGWLFSADFDFSKGKVSQKNLFLQYTLQHAGVSHAFKAGYYSNPATMSGNTSSGSYHFISRPAPFIAFGPKRELGASYSAYNDHFFTNQGVFATNFYSADLIGFQNLAAGGRWLFRLRTGDGAWMHAGVTFRYENLQHGEMDMGQIKPVLKVAGTLETKVDAGGQFVNASLPWAKHVFDVTGEFLYMRSNMFLRGEYLFKYVAKARDGQKMLESQLGGAYAWTTVAAMEKALPLRANKFQGGYIEAGYKIFGPDYSYSTSSALVGGLNGFACEAVARYSYVGLNDIVPGEKYMAGRDQYYPTTGIADYPKASTSVGGGNLHSVTVGVNWILNRYAQLLASYTCGLLQHDKFPTDKAIHAFQLRLQMQI